VIFLKIHDRQRTGFNFRRIAIIKLIDQGKKYNDIKMILRISDNTISNSRDIMAGRGYGQNPNRKECFQRNI